MATETTTIRVPRETRDLLAEQARQRGISLSAMLTRVAHREERDALFRAEREATVIDHGRADVEREDQIWSGAITDGID